MELEQELVRAEAQSLVAEAQLTNVVRGRPRPHCTSSALLISPQTRQKLKEAYDLQTAATIERAEKQILLAKQSRRLLSLLDDSPIVPGDTHPAFDRADDTRQVLNDAEDDLRNWAPSYEQVPSNAGNLSMFRCAFSCSTEEHQTADACADVNAMPGAASEFSGPSRANTTSTIQHGGDVSATSATSSVQMPAAEREKELSTA